MTRGVFSHTTQDEYYTPSYAVNIIIPYIPEGVKKIWCPFDTESSKYVIELRSMGYEVVATHIDDGYDFLNYEPEFTFDAIISNPPFSLKSEILGKCLDYGKPFALLLPFTMFNSISTVRQIHNTGIEFLIMDRRISFDGQRPNFTCWYVCRGFLDKKIETFLFNDDPKELWLKEANDVK